MKKWAITTLILFLVLLPFSLKINFYQNDDWVYYKNVTYFAHGEFRLDDYLGPTFFAQGILGLLFSSVFGLNRLPVLTLLVACINFFIFGKILIKYYKKDYTTTLLLSCLYFFSPIHVYLLWGFMTGVYGLFVILLSLYLYMDNKTYLAYAVSVVGIFVRQILVIIPLGIGLFHIVKKEYKKGLVGVAVFLAESIYLQKFFPLTSVMKRAAPQFQHLWNVDHVVALSYGSLLMVTAFLLPVFIGTISLKHKKLLILGTAIVLLLAFGTLFKPHTISWGEFPYFENTFERTGFYPRGVHGTKYQFRGIYDLYKYWDLAAKVVVVLALATLAVTKKFKINVFLSVMAVYLLLMLLVETFYDRYLLLFIPLTLLYLVDTGFKFTKTTYLLTSGFLVFMLFYTYNFTMDFFAVNKYINYTAQSLPVDPKYVHATNSWKLDHLNTERDYIYFFSYDSPEVNSDLKSMYKLIEKHKISYFGNFFINPYVYLYQKL